VDLTFRSNLTESRQPVVERRRTSPVYRPLSLPIAIDPPCRSRPISPPFGR